MRNCHNATIGVPLGNLAAPLQHLVRRSEVQTEHKVVHAAVGCKVVTVDNAVIGETTAPFRPLLVPVYRKNFVVQRDGMVDFALVVVVVVTGDGNVGYACFISKPLEQRRNHRILIAPHAAVIAVAVGDVARCESRDDFFTFGVVYDVIEGVAQCALVMVV